MSNAIPNRIVEMDVSPATKAMVQHLCRKWHQSEPVVISRVWTAYKRRHPEVAEATRS